MPAYGRGGRGERKGKERIKKREEERKGEGEKEKREKEGRSKEEGKSERRVWKVRRKEEGVDEKEKSQKAWRLNFTNSHYGATVIYLLLMHSSMHLKQYLCPHGVTQASSMRDMHIGQWKCS